MQRVNLCKYCKYAMNGRECTCYRVSRFTAAQRDAELYYFTSTFRSQGRIYNRSVQTVLPNKQGRTNLGAPHSEQYFSAS